MYCPHCGLDNDDGEVFCVDCGEPLPEFMPPSKVSAPAPQKNKNPSPVPTASTRPRSMFAKILFILVQLIILIAFSIFLGFVVYIFLIANLDTINAIF